jgi:HPt (histidine-containing phosphotransfer) domain-containing protein
MPKGSNLSREFSTAVGETRDPKVPFRVARLLERCLSDREFCASLVQKFAARAEELSAGLEQAAGRQDLTEIACHAHALKGMAANLSADALQSWAAALERAVLGGTIEETLPLVARVRMEVQRCVDAVPTLLERIGASE